MKNSVGEALGRILYMIPDYPSQAQIEITNRCNLTCKMCPRDYFNLLKEDMPLETFKKIVDRLENITLLTLTGWGEPLVHPHIFEMITYCKERSHKVKLTTNGTLLTSEMRQRVFSSGLDEITISLESINKASEVGHTNLDVLQHIKDLAKERQDNIPTISLQATLHKGRGQDVYEVIRFGKEAGVQRINLGRLDVRLNENLERPSAQEEISILREADRLGRELGIRVDSIQYALFDGFERTTYKILKSVLHRFGKYCLRLYDYVYINQKAEVTPCCGMPTYGMGNILEKGLGEIWKSKEYQYFREHHNLICGKCDLWRVKCQLYE
ncbi:MAG: radical SAM protein [Deltaproteobacteria bacterium]|nr:radical SAM protein [Deltaproteobacteria bacterium]